MLENYLYNRYQSFFFYLELKPRDVFIIMYINKFELIAIERYYSRNFDSRLTARSNVHPKRGGAYILPEKSFKHFKYVLEDLDFCNYKLFQLI